MTQEEELWFISQGYDPQEHAEIIEHMDYLQQRGLSLSDFAN
jgi:hypothetical protein